MNPSLTGIVSGTMALLLTFTLTFTSPTRAQAQTDNGQMTLPGNAPSDLTVATLDVINLYLSGANQDVLTTYVQTSDQLFDLSPADIDYLINIGLPQDTIAVMLQTDANTWDRLAAQQAQAEPYANDYPYNGYDYDNSFGYPGFIGSPFLFNFQSNQARHHVRHFGHNRNFNNHVMGRSAMAPHSFSHGAVASRGGSHASGGHR